LQFARGRVQNVLWAWVVGGAIRSNRVTPAAKLLLLATAISHTLPLVVISPELVVLLRSSVFCFQRR
jgi:hypothetical protein